MNLRELKQRGHFATMPVGAFWRHFHEHERVRCPYSDCGRACEVVWPNTVISTRIPEIDRGPGLYGGTRTCQSCRRNFDAAVTAVPERPPKLA